jgi:hypothetical protein
VKSILVIAIAVGVASAVLGSFLFQSFTPVDNAPQQMELEEKCQKIATEGFQIQVKYSEINFETMPKEDADALKYLDDLWINDCVTQLPGEKIFEIAKKAEQDYYSGE